jgi:hypothetical protein
VEEQDGEGAASPSGVGGRPHASLDEADGEGSVGQPQDEVCRLRSRQGGSPITLKGEFDKICMAEGELLDDYAGKISGMAARYASLGSTLDDAAMVKKLLDTVPDRLYPAVAGIEQFYDVETMLFEEALSRLKAFDECSRRRTTRRPAHAHGGRVASSAEIEEVVDREVLQLRRSRPFHTGLPQAQEGGGVARQR